MDQTIKTIILVVVVRQLRILLLQLIHIKMYGLNIVTILGNL